MAITGTDDLSLKILDSLESGTKVKDIPGIFSVSLDQAKRLSRYHNILEEAKEHLSPQALQKIQDIGLKVLHLAPLFKAKDYQGLTEILSSINANTKRDELSLLIKALEEKRQRVAAFQQKVNLDLQNLQFKEEKLTELEEETVFLKKYKVS